MDRRRHRIPYIGRPPVRRHIRLLAAALAALPFLGLPAGAQRLQFRRLGSDDGLAGPWVQAILQDSRGFMWFGTSQGVNRYDGYTMETFRAERGNPRALPDNIVYDMREDRSGTIWVGTRAGLSRFDRDRNDFTTFDFRERGDRVQHQQVRAILEDSRGVLWIGTTEGLFTFDRARLAKTAIPLPPSRVRAIQYIYAVYEDRRGHILVGTEGDGILDIEPGTGRVREFGHARPGATEFPSNDVRSFIEDREGRLWVATYDAGLVLLDPESGRYTAYRHDPRNPDGPPNDRTGHMALDADGQLWVAFENGGLVHFDPRTRRFTTYRTDPNDPSGVSSDSYWGMFVDATGTLWAGTFAGGVDVLRPSSDAIQRFSSVAGLATSLSYNSIVGFAQDSAGGIWVATDGGGIDRLDPSTGRFRRYTTKNSALPRDAVLCAAVDARGMVWMGLWDGGVTRLDPRTGRMTSYTSANSGLPEDNIFAVHHDRRGRIWLGTLRYGLVLFDPARRTVKEFHYATRGAESQIWIIEELHDGRLALGTLAGGLVIFDPATSRMTVYNSTPTSPAVLPSSDIRAVVETSPGVLWIGTSDGLARLDLATNRVRRFSTRDGLGSDMVAGIVPDRAGRLWVSSDQGITEFDPERGTARQYAVQDGLQERQFTARAYLRGGDGMLLFGGNRGFNLIRPERIRHNPRKPRVVLTGFEVFNKPVPIGEPGSPLARHISEAKRVRLTHRQSVFTIEYAALDFTAPAKNQYAYRLEGFDRDWTYAGSKRAATYTSLEPGRYVFRVKASNNDGVWNEAGTSLEIEITPPFWASWWFRSLVALVVVTTVVTMVRRAQARQRHLQAMNEQLGHAAERDRESQQYLERNVLDILGAMQCFSAGDYSVELDVASDDVIGKLRAGFNSVVADRKRAEEELRQKQKMEAVGRLAGGVAHDFNNLLTVIKGNAELGLADVGSAVAVREELEEIERAAERASSLTRQLLAFSRKQILKPQLLSLNDCVSNIARMLSRTVGEDIELRIVLDPALGVVRADPGQIEQVLLNLVVNARDAMPRGGRLLVETRNVAPETVRGLADAEAIPYVSVAVADTGTGMAAAVKDRIFEPFFTTKEQGKGTGLGLATVYGSVRQSGGFVHVESEPGQGSTFSIFLPRVEERDEPRTTSEHEAVLEGSATVLLAEDEDAVRRLASRVLERAGYRVLEASSGEEAMRIAEQHAGTIDLLMTDVVMPGMSGRELAEQLVPRHAGMRLLYASGYTEDAIVRHGVSSHETAFLEKPFTPNALLRKVREVLDAAPHEGVAPVAG
jgi:signal transduction histidine kinase/ligand-binding sensor domain-containing protein/ActR/RegA family two-component response regulator